jgi:hypothetical protein
VGNYDDNRNAGMPAHDEAYTFTTCLTQKILLRNRRKCRLNAKCRHEDVGIPFVGCGVSDSSSKGSITYAGTTYMPVRIEDQGGSKEMVSKMTMTGSISACRIGSRPK